MSNGLQYKPVDSESIKKKLLQLQSTSNKSQKLWKATPGESVVRVLPYKFGPDPFNLLYFHYDIAGKSALCPSTFGKECPICEFANTLRATKTEEGWQGFKKISAKMRVYIPIIVRGKENEGPKFWGVSRTVYETLLTFYTNPDYGDLSHPLNGTDITVKFTGPNERLRFGETTVLPKRNSSALHADKATMINIISNVPNINEIYPEQSYEELKKLLDEHIAKIEEESTPKEEVIDAGVPPILTQADKEQAPVTDLDKDFEELFK